MAIKIYKDKIEFIDGANVFTLTETTAGFDLNGTLTADSYTGLFQGEIAGYTSGGTYGGNTIDKFPFATNANATDVGDMTRGGYNTAGQSSTVSGYTSGGAPGSLNIIDKFPFASNANATDVGDLTQARKFVAGQSSTVSGYTSGGFIPPNSNVIDKFPFASNANATDVGDMTVTTYGASGQSSPESGYNSSGNAGPPSAPLANTISKFPFATDANATDVGDLLAALIYSAGQSSLTDGYVSGGAYVNTINKFPFSTNSNATDVGDLTQPRGGPTGQSSTTSGFSSGGTFPPTSSNRYNTIDKFPFASNANATDHGDLTVTRYSAAGQQD